MIVSQSRPAIAILVAISLATIATIAQAEPSGKWRIEFRDKAADDGVITLRISPEGGAPVDVTTKVNANSSPNRAARAVRDALRVYLGERYYVEIENRGDVVVGRLDGAPMVEISIGSSTLSGMQIRINRE